MADDIIEEVLARYNERRGQRGLLPASPDQIQNARVVAEIAADVWFALEGKQRRRDYEHATARNRCSCDWDHTGHVSHRITDRSCPEHGHPPPT